MSTSKLDPLSLKKFPSFGRFDYIARDTHQIGGNKCNLAALRYYQSDCQHLGQFADYFRRLIKSSRVIDGHITYSNKDITNVFLVFQERWSLHKRGECNTPDRTTTSPSA
jgi:hypothetical protein